MKEFCEDLIKHLTEKKNKKNEEILLLRKEVKKHIVNIA